MVRISGYGTGSILMENKAVYEPVRVRKLMETLAGCLAELDSIQAHLAGAHLDSALHALRQQFGCPDQTSDIE